MKAPAKINYDLFITGRREDGYHLLNSKFIPIENLHDDVEINFVGVPLVGIQKKKWKVGVPFVGNQEKKRTRSSVGVPLVGTQRQKIAGSHKGGPYTSCAKGIKHWRNKWHFKTAKISLKISGNDQIPNDNSNLVWKAAETFLNYVQKSPSIKIKLTKRIPVSAGLGGGSSNAAAILKLLNQHFPVSDEKLIELAASIGADVPFFLNPKPSIVSGIGEIIEPIETEKEQPILLISPNINISAAEAYKLYKKSGVEFSKVDRTNPKNDLEEPVLKKYIALRLIRSELQKVKNVKEVRMTGSGSTFFMTFDNIGEAEQAQQELRNLRIAECGLVIADS